jgi:CheY-like chemotaxis protein
MVDGHGTMCLRLSPIGLLMKLRIIVLDLDEGNRELVSSIARIRGHEVLAFAEPYSCPLYSHSECDCPQDQACGDLMIIDTRMLKMTGLEFIRRQRDHGCKGALHNKLVLSTTAGKEEEIRFAKELGCKIIKKPFKVKDILDWIDECEKTIDPNRTLVEFSSG